MSSFVQELRTAHDKVLAEMDRIRSERTALLLQLEAAEREKQRLERQREAVTLVPQDRTVNVPNRRSA